MLIHGDSPLPPDDGEDDARQGPPAAAARWLAVGSAALVALVAVSRLVTCACPRHIDIASSAVVALQNA